LWVLTDWLREKECSGFGFIFKWVLVILGCWFFISFAIESNGVSKGILGNSLEFSQVLSLLPWLAASGHH